MHPIRFVVRVLGAVALTALVTTSLPRLAARADPASAPNAAGLDPAAVDPTCRPCDDFYQFAVGGWRKTHTIPPGHASWGSFDELTQRNRETLHAILEEAARDTAAPANSDTQKVGAYYRACMDEAAIERAGTAPIAPLLAGVAGVTDSSSLVSEIAKLQPAGVSDGLDFSSEPDVKDSSQTIATIGLGGLGLPDRDYYLNADQRAAKVRVAYRAYVAAQLENLDEPAAAATADADAVVALETAFARSMPTLAEQRDPKATYHPMPVAELSQLAPHLAWSAFFASLGAPRLVSIDISVPAYVKAYDTQLEATPPATWQAYLRFHVVDAYARALPKRFADASFAFHSRVLYGVSEELPRWQRCTAAAEASLRTPLGKAYVAHNFPPAAKARALQLVDALQATLRDDIGTLSWMGPQTKRRAVAKLDAYKHKIGYPDAWIDYSTLTIDDGAVYAALVQRIRAWHHARDVARIGQPTDRGLWEIAAPTVNAYYDPYNNEIVFPAGILQPPFFDARADDAVNYGAIGAVIGHEMTHGFDNTGRQFDAKGNLVDWQTPQDAAAFGRRAQCVVDEFNALEPIPGVRQNGALVEGEAIADLGGATIAFKTFARTAEYRAHRTIGGYTPEQRFFLAFAQVWRSIQTEAYTRQLAISDPHPNDRLRVIGTLSNMPEFRAAFACAANSAMVRKKRCRVW